MRERRCIVTRETAGEEALIRFVAGPDGNVVADIAAKLPGRGAWVEARRDTLELALKRGLLTRTLEARSVDPDLADKVEALLRQRALALMGLARKAGLLAVGADAVRLSLKSQAPAWRIEAMDGAVDGRQKIDRLTLAAWGGIPVAGCFSAEALGAATGRDHLVHAVLNPGPHIQGFAAVMNKLAGFTDIDPVSSTGGNG